MTSSLAGVEWQVSEREGKERSKRYFLNGLSGGSVLSSKSFLYIFNSIFFFFY